MGIVSATDGDEGQNAMISFLTNDNNGSKCMTLFKWFVTNESDRNTPEGGRNSEICGNLCDYFKYSSDTFQREMLSLFVIKIE